jgi:hypothetical protein
MIIHTPCFATTNPFPHHTPSLSIVDFLEITIILFSHQPPTPPQVPLLSFNPPPPLFRRHNPTVYPQ